MRRRNGRAHRQRQAERFGDAGHGAGGAHHHAGADRRREPAVDGLDLDVVDFAGAVFAPQPPAIGAGAEHLALVMTDHHRPDRNHHGRQIGGDRRHDLRRQGLVAAADHDHRVHRLGADHLLGIHRHQIAQVHRGRMRKAFGDRDGREHHRHRARQHHAALHRLDDLRHVAVAGIVVAVGVGDADDRAVQRVVGIAHRLDEGLAQEQRKPGIAITRQSLAKSVVSHSLVIPVVVGPALKEHAELLSMFDNSARPDAEVDAKIRTSLLTMKGDAVLTFRQDETPQAMKPLAIARRFELRARKNRRRSFAGWKRTSSSAASRRARGWSRTP